MDELGAQLTLAKTRVNACRTEVIGTHMRQRVTGITRSPTGRNNMSMVRCMKQLVGCWAVLRFITPPIDTRRHAILLRALWSDAHLKGYAIPC